MIKPDFILASASPRRKELIALAGIDAEIVPSMAKEDIVCDDPEQLVLQLSQKKALEVAERVKNGSVVIGADTCVYVPVRGKGAHGGTCHGGTILGKPHTHEEAANMVRMLSGDVHSVFTGVTIAQYTHAGTRLKIRSFVEETHVHVFPITEAEIREYADSDEPMDKAGAYGIQGAFARFIERLEGDYFNVMGLPVGRLYREIRDFTETVS